MENIETTLLFLKLQRKFKGTVLAEKLKEILEEEEEETETETMTSDLFGEWKITTSAKISKLKKEIDGIRIKRDSLKRQKNPQYLDAELVIKAIEIDIAKLEFQKDQYNSFLINKSLADLAARQAKEKKEEIQRAKEAKVAEDAKYEGMTHRERVYAKANEFNRPWGVYISMP